MPIVEEAAVKTKCKRTEPAKLTWHAVQTKPSSEALAEFHLRRQGYRVIAPWHPEETIRNRRAIVVRRFTFGRYMFVGLGHGQAHSPINSTIGVDRLLTVSEQSPLVIPFPVIKVILDEAEFDGLIWPRETAGQTFEVGEERRVTAGPFIDRLATVAGTVDNAGHVAVLIGHLRASMPAYALGDLVSPRVR